MRLQDTKNVKAMIDRMNAQSGTEVIANPELTGDEAALTGLEVAGTKYKVGGNTQEKYILTGDVTWMSGEEVTITDETNLATLNAYKSAVAEGIYPIIGFTLPGSTTVYTPFQATINYEETIYGAEGDYVRFVGVGFVDVTGMTNTFIKVAITYGVSGEDRTWTVTITPLSE